MEPNSQHEEPVCNADCERTHPFLPCTRQPAPTATSTGTSMHRVDWEAVKGTLAPSEPGESAEQFKTVTDHKFIAQECHESGCQSLVLRAQLQKRDTRIQRLRELVAELDPERVQPPYDHDNECSYCGTKEGRKHPHTCTWEKLKQLSK